MLSGGLDSSIIAAVLAQQLRQSGAPRLRTYSIGFPDSTDVKFAREIAAHIDSDHRECLIAYEQALNVLPDVVRAIESYDTTTVRASTPMFLLSQYIAANGDRCVS
jgi:asparagine synthase (glutamine-hydrolysing)